MPDIPRCKHKGGARFLVNVLIENGIPRVQAYALDCPAVHDMARVLARANYLARTDRALLLDEYPPPITPGLRWWQGWSWVALCTASALGTGFALILICSPVWRSLT